MLDNTELSQWRMADDRRDAWQVDVADTGLDFTLAAGGVRRRWAR